MLGKGETMSARSDEVATNIFNNLQPGSEVELTLETLKEVMEAFQQETVEDYEGQREPDQYEYPEELQLAIQTARLIDIDDLGIVDSWQECPGCGLMGVHRSDCLLTMINEMVEDLTFI